MAKLFVIAGHGAGDCGACGNGYQEAERVRALAQRIKDFGGDDVLLGDFNRNYYKDNGISKLTISKDYKIIELHMDSSSSSSARGGHVIIKAGFSADDYDKKLAEFISGMFAGRKKIIVGRTDLANPNRAASNGYNYRLVECGFISNADDVKIFNSKMDELAKGILACFDIGVNENTSNTSSNTSTYTGNSIVDYLNSIEKASDFSSRKIYAAQYGITNYTGTASQNTKLLSLMRRNASGTNSVAYYPKYNGNSYGIDTVFAAIGVPEKFRGSWSKRKPVASANGISNYKGTASQNTSLIALAKKGQLKKV